MTQFPLDTALKDCLPRVIEWRHSLHACPELGYEERETAAFVAERLRECGLDVVTGIGGTGVVGTLRRGTSARSLGIRAELDALPINERPGRPHGSRHSGRMHACGHDGHMAMVLGAATLLAGHGDFDGTVHFIFQPAEENLAGGKAMVDDGLFERFPMDAIYAMHNLPGMPVGQFAVQTGPAMASADMFEITLHGRGGHAAHPHLARDPGVGAAEIVLALQSIVARSLPPLEAGVVSVTKLAMGSTFNVIPDTAVIAGTFRAHKPAIRARIEERLRTLVTSIAAAHELTADIDFPMRYPPTVNNAAEARRAAQAAIRFAGAENVRLDLPASMGAEDFAWLLEKCPGCYVRIGNGVEGAHAAPLHTPDYDFNDDALAHGIGFWSTLVRQELQPEATQ